MRNLLGLALVGVFAATLAGEARAQGVSQGSAGYRYTVPAGGAAYAQPYAFKDESLLSINRSYLGYSNLVDTSGHPPAPGYVTRYGAAQVRGVPYAPPARRGLRLFGARRYR